jgi:hypothetical protein
MIGAVDETGAIGAADESDPAETGEIDVRLLADADALGLRACLERCYGDGYPKRVLYRPEATAALIRSKGYAGVVAVSEDGIVGHIGYSRTSPDSLVVEAGTTIVDPRCRGRGLMGRMSEKLGEQMVAEGVEGVIQFPTTAHEVMQRAATISGHETGILLAYIPGTAFSEAGAGATPDRVAVTVVYQGARETAEQTIFVPERYMARLEALAASLSLPRVIGAGHQVATDSDLDSSCDEARSLTRIAVRRAGVDLAGEVLSRSTGPATGLVHVDLSMADPGICAAAEALRALGFVYGAWLPGWRGHDVLRMQLIRTPTDRELSPSLVTGDARELLAAIRDELDEVSRQRTR